jgi:hypothetical protein
VEGVQPTRQGGEVAFGPEGQEGAVGRLAADAGDVRNRVRPLTLLLLLPAAVLSVAGPAPPTLDRCSSHAIRGTEDSGG